ncbi:borealin-2 isoform X2 [Nelusetta ayraudi]|uniref:borealin-2 isoform X2 n=1 Tax=Nelusetta ayraudi TaxID=303726 RepID=UPI003F6FE896
MPGNRVRAGGSTQTKELRSREIRRNKLELFIQQFEKEAQGRMTEVGAEKENVLSTIDRVFKAELLKMPPSLQNTLIGDLISEAEVGASEVSIAMKSESLQKPLSVKKVSRGRLKSTDSASSKPTTVQRASSNKSKRANGTKRTRTYAGSNSTGNLRNSSATTKRMQSVESKDPRTKHGFRSVVSTGDIHCSMAASAAHITVSTAQGQTLSFSDETKDEINLALLDDVAWCQIQKLSSLMEYLSRQSRCQR